MQEKLRELIAKWRKRRPGYGDADECADELEAAIAASEPAPQPLKGEDAWLDEFVEAVGAADAETRTAVRRVFRTILRAFSANLKQQCTCDMREGIYCPVHRNEYLAGAARADKACKKQ